MLAHHGSDSWLAGLRIKESAWSGELMGLVIGDPWLKAGGWGVGTLWISHLRTTYHTNNSYLSQNEMVQCCAS